MTVVTVSKALDARSLDALFLKARTRNGWMPQAVSDETIRELFDLCRWGPTAANSNPARFVFIRSAAAKERLRPHLAPGNLDKTMSAPCCVIVGYDTKFYDLMPKLFPSREMRDVFAGNDALIDETIKRNGTLQGAYFMMAARALGLDCGPLSGFNAQTLDADFFPDGRWKSNFLCNIGYGSEENLYPRNPRLEFEEACMDL